MNLRVTMSGEVKRLCRATAVKASLKRAPKYVGVDAKPSDLHMSRLKSR